MELFRRDGRRLTLTEAGHVFVKEAESSLRQFEHAQQAARRAARREVGTLALDFQSTAGLSVVPQLLQRFRTLYPDVEVLLREMGTSAQIIALRAGELDVALMYSLGSEEFAYHDLVPESLVIALPDHHPFAQRDSVALKDLSQEVLILPASEVAAVLHHAVLAECADADFEPKRLQEVATAQTALGLVSAQFGVAILPGSVRTLTRAGVVLRPIRNSRIQIQLALLWPKHHPSPIVSRLLECAK